MLTKKQKKALKVKFMLAKATDNLKDREDYKKKMYPCLHLGMLMADAGLDTKKANVIRLKVYDAVKVDGFCRLRLTA